MKTLSGYAASLLLGASLLVQMPAHAADSATTDRASGEEMNIRAYMELLRTDVKKSKAQIMGEVMQLDADQAQKFWPIYKEFETELAKLGDQVVAAIRSYAENYGKLTDATADQLAGKVLTIEQQRNTLKKKYYDRMKSSLGGITLCVSAGGESAGKNW